MAYCSTTAILNILPALPNTATVTNVIDRHITRADALIDAKITTRYATPISPTPPLIASLSEDIAAYYTFRSYYAQDNTNRTENLDELRVHAIAVLDEIRDGKIDLVDSTGAQIAERSSEVTTGILDSTTRTYQPFFDVDDELNQGFDSDLLDDVADNR